MQQRLESQWLQSIIQSLKYIRYSWMENKKSLRSVHTLLDFYDNFLSKPDEHNDVNTCLKSL